MQGIPFLMLTLMHWNGLEITKTESCYDAKFVTGDGKFGTITTLSFQLMYTWML